MATPRISGHALERLDEAVRLLNSPNMPLRLRVQRACIDGLLRVNARQAPDDLRVQCEDLRKRLAAVPAEKDEGTLVATLDTMTDAQLEAIGEEIEELARYAHIRAASPQSGGAGRKN